MTAASVFNKTTSYLEPLIGRSELLRTSDLEEGVVEGTVYPGDAVIGGTAQTQITPNSGTATNFKGLVNGHSIRQSNTETKADALTAAKKAIYQKPSGGKTRRLVTISGVDGGASAKRGDPVFYMKTGLTITNVRAGDLFCGAVTAEHSKIGTLAEDLTLPDSTSETNNVLGEIDY